MEFVNLTPHKVSIYNEEKMLVLEVQPSGTVARVTAQRKHVYTTLNGVPLFVTRYGEIEGLPEETDGISYIVSGLVRAAAPERRDLWQPGELLRNADGQPIGCIGLSR